MNKIHSDMKKSNYYKFALFLGEKRKYIEIDIFLTSTRRLNCDLRETKRTMLFGGAWVYVGGSFYFIIIL